MAHYKKDETILVGLDSKAIDASSSIVLYAKQLAELTQMKLHFVHICQPNVLHSGGNNHLGEAYWLAISQEVEKENQRHLNNKLIGLQASFSENFKVSVSIRTGKVEQELLLVAKEKNAALILIETKSAHIGALERSFSIAANLLNSSPVPVLVVQSGAKVQKIVDNGVRILLADDLKETSLNAVRECFSLASSVGNTLKTKVMHVHVHSRSSFLNIAKEVWQTIKSKLALPEHLEQEALLDKESSEKLLLLEQRVVPYKSKIEEAKCEYLAKIITGQDGESFEDIAIRFDADLIIFGRHRTIPLNPLPLGGMAFQSMLASQRPILVCPN